MTASAFIWITARDGSIHATRPPIQADGQAMLCERQYDRLDLKVRARVGGADGYPAGACPICRDLSGLAPLAAPARRGLAKVTPPA